MMTDIPEAETTNIQPEIDNEDVDLSDATRKLAAGLLAIYQPSLEQVKKQLQELTTKQESLLTEMQFENKKLRDTFEDVELNEMFATIKVYQGKLVSLKQEMVTIHERTFRLKKRALRLQQIKQKEILNREQQREQEIRREQELILKPSI